MNILNILGKIILLAIFSFSIMAMEEQSETEDEITEREEEQVNKMSFAYLLSSEDNKEKNDFFIYEDPLIKNPKENKIICKFCYKEYKNTAYYERHLKQVHWHNFIDLEDDNKYNTTRHNFIDLEYNELNLPTKHSKLGPKKVPNNFFVKPKITKNVKNYQCHKCYQTFVTNLKYRRHLFNCKK